VIGSCQQRTNDQMRPFVGQDFEHGMRRTGLAKCVIARRLIGGEFITIAISDTSTIAIASARFPKDGDIVRALFTEYVDALGIDLSFQDVSAELAKLPGKYSPPAGGVLIARDSENYPVGCIALRPLKAKGTCEMKRLYVRPQARGQDLGYRLAVEIMGYGKTAGYTRIVLDTLASMQTAQKLYARLGFHEIRPYYENPVPGTLYLGRSL
jgi:ribosomal protein S18 acetylase RimI-like enzyme